MEDRLPRKLAAILYADVVGYSRLTGEDEDATHRTLSQYLDLITTTVESHRGQVMHYAGDAVLAKFDAVVDAISAAVGIQNELKTRNESLPDGRKVQFRIGVNSGDVIEDRGDIYGDGVNVAARLESLAAPGGICISESVRTAVGKKLNLAYEFMGEQGVKNIANPVRAYRVLLDPEKLEASSPQTSTLELPDKPSIAVLPFTNMSRDSEQEYFSEGITEDIITELSRFSGLFVIARNSSFAYKGKSVDVRRIARELGVRYVLEGSIRRAGNRVRINAQLLDKETGSHIWAERYDRDLEHIFDLQEEITRNVVASIAPQIEMAEIKRVRRVRSTNLSAYDLALKAQALLYDGLRMGNPGVLEQAIETAHESLKRDSRNVHALWTQAFAYYVQYLYRWGSAPDEALKRAWAAVEHLVEIDSSNPHAHMMRGTVHQLQGARDAALADYRRAFALNPNFAWNLFAMAWGESLAGLTEAAREHAELGLRLSPRDMDFWLGMAYLALAQASFADGNFEKAKEWGMLAIQMHSKAPIRRALMTACCGQLGDLEEAARQAEQLKEFAPDFIPSILRGDMTLYKMPEHNALLVDGLRKAGLPA